MDQANEFIKTILVHDYNPATYDPQKAHDYYLRTRELKGKSSSTEGLGKKDKKQWATIKAAINEDKSTESKDLAAKKTAELTKLRESVQAKRAEIRNAIKQALQSIKENTQASLEKANQNKADQLSAIANKRQADLEKAQAKTQSDLDALAPLPLKPTRAEKAAHAADVARIKGEGKSETAKIINESRSQEKAVREGSVGERKAISEQRTQQSQAVHDEAAAKMTSDLKDTVKAAQVKYDTLKKQLVAKYESISNQQLEFLKNN